MRMRPIKPSVRPAKLSDPRCATADYRPSDAYPSHSTLPIVLEPATSVPSYTQSIHAVPTSPLTNA